MDKKQKPVIAVIGGNEADASVLEQAREAGRLIAQAGATLLCGGLGGVMEAASGGASEAGGLVLGILPGEDKAAANPYIDVPVATGFGTGRNIILVRTADALIAVGGQYGTLSEIAHALQLKKPVFGIGSWDIEGVIRAEDAKEAVGMALEHIKASQ